MTDIKPKAWVYEWRHHVHLSDEDWMKEVSLLKPESELIRNVVPLFTISDIKKLLTNKSRSEKVNIYSVKKADLEDCNEIGMRLQLEEDEVLVVKESELGKIFVEIEILEKLKEKLEAMG